MSLSVAAVSSTDDYGHCSVECQAIVYVVCSVVKVPLDATERTSKQGLF